MLKEAMQRGFVNVGPVENGFSVSNSALPVSQVRDGTCFSFQKRFERVDWKKLASVDIGKVCNELDIQTLQENLSNIAFCNIESELDKSIDPNFIKLFKLAQLLIEYLLHSQEYLTGVIEALEERIREANQDLLLMKKERSKEQHLLADLQRENKKTKKMLVKQQHIFSGLIGNSNRCPFCPKAFINVSFLKCHLSRRHPHHEATTSVNSNGLTSNNDPEALADHNVIEALRTELQQVKEMLKHSENIELEKNTQAGRERAEKIERMRKEIQMWKEESERHKIELENAQKTFLKELKELHEKQQNYDEALSALKHAHSMPPQSNFGPLLDETNDENVKLLSEQKEQINSLKMQLKSQVATMENILQDELLKKEREWKARVMDLKEQHSAELQKVSLHRVMDLEEQHSAELQKVSLQKTSPKKKPPRTFNQGHKQTNDFLRKVPQVVNGEWKRSDRLTSALAYSPDLLMGLQKELCGLIEDKLQKYGIKPSVSSVSSELVNKKLNQLKNERSSLAERYKTFYEIRQYYANTIDELSRNKLKMIQNKSTDSVSSPFKINHTLNTSSRKETASPEAGDLGDESFHPVPLPRKVNFKNVKIQDITSSNKDHLAMGEPEVLRVKPFNSDIAANQPSLEKQSKAKPEKPLLPGSIKVLPQMSASLQNEGGKRLLEIRRDSENKLSSISTSVWDTKSYKLNGHSDSADSTNAKNSLASVSSWDSEEDLSIEEIH